MHVHFLMDIKVHHLFDDLVNLLIYLGLYREIKSWSVLGASLLLEHSLECKGENNVCC